jgi:hypothetical protein
MMEPVQDRVVSSCTACGSDDRIQSHTQRTSKTSLVYSSAERPGPMGSAVNSTCSSAEIQFAITTLPVLGMTDGNGRRRISRASAWRAGRLTKNQKRKQAVKRFRGWRKRNSNHLE